MSCCINYHTTSESFFAMNNLLGFLPEWPHLGEILANNSYLCAQIHWFELHIGL